MLLLGNTGTAVDIWSFGCLVFEIVTGRRHFAAFYWGDSWTKENQDDELLLKLFLMLGPLPEELYNHWSRSALYFTPERKLYNCEPGGVAAGEEPFMVEGLEEQSMEDDFDKTEPDISAEEARAIELLIRKILEYDPKKRPSAAEILRDPWLAGV